MELSTLICLLLWCVSSRTNTVKVIMVNINTDFMSLISYVFRTFISSALCCFEASEMLHFSLSLMNRLNKTVSTIFIFLLWLGCSRGIDFLPEYFSVKWFVLYDVEIINSKNILLRFGTELLVFSLAFV